MSKDTDLKDMLEWAEKAGIENMKTHHVCADNLSKEAATTLTLTLAGMGGGLAYAAKALEAHSWTWFSIGASGFTVWLVITSWYLTSKCLMMSPLHQIYNEPKNLFDEKETLTYLKERELLSLQVRIDETGKRNARLAGHLNIGRKLAILSPAAFIFCALASVAAAH